MDKIDDFLSQELIFTPAVVGYLVKDNQVLLGLRKKVSLGLGQNLIAGIGGKVGDQEEFRNESAAEALIREAEEEIGVGVKSQKLMGQVRFIFPQKPNWNQIVSIYLITDWEGEPVETESIKPSWYEVLNLPSAQMWDDNSYWLPKVLSGQKIKATFLYAEDNKVKEFRFEE